jgi:hypothetical protein
MPNVKWEYRTIETADDAELRELGAEGWELVGGNDAGWVLKRPVADFRERVTLDQRRRYFALWGIDIDAVDGMSSR